MVLDPPPVEVEQLIERRQRLGQDRYHEMWEGVYHMAPMARFGHGYLDQQLAELLGPLAREAGLVMTSPFNLGAANNSVSPTVASTEASPIPMPPSCPPRPW